jgi:phage tail sheath protein FI
MYIPTRGKTVPLFFIATAAEKLQPDGVSYAAGTFESNVIRVVTSLQQSVQLYGIPNFLRDSSENPLHGDSRNEYGLFALNQFLGMGGYAYVVRANINLNDNLADIRTMWINKMTEASYSLQNISQAYLNEYNQSNGFVPSSPNYKTTIDITRVQSLINTATLPIWQMSSFQNSQSDLMANHTSAPYSVYTDGYSNTPTNTFLGIAGAANIWVTNGLGTVIPSELTPTEAGAFLLESADLLKFTTQFLNHTSLGANDAARRSVAIVPALLASIVSNTDIRSESYEYDIVACPGYHETTTALINLIADIGEEAFVVADTPFDKSPESVGTWSRMARTAEARNSAIYYPHGMASNLDGNTVFVAASGIAIRTIAYSDNVSDVFFAPAGTRRGLVTGITEVGYITGTIGTATTFNPVALNVAQRNYLYGTPSNINPITFFPGRGIIIFGQKTLDPDTSALDRINVVRLVQLIKRDLRKNTMSFVFEPNDKLTRDNLKSVVDSYLSNLIINRGLYDYVTVCDESNNTAYRIDNNQIYIDVALKPVKSAEFIYIPVRVVSTGATLTG